MIISTNKGVVFLNTQEKMKENINKLRFQKLLLNNNTVGFL